MNASIGFRGNFLDEDEYEDISAAIGVSNKGRIVPFREIQKVFAAFGLTWINTHTTGRQAVVSALLHS